MNCPVGEWFGSIGLVLSGGRRRIEATSAADGDTIKLTARTHRVSLRLSNCQQCTCAVQFDSQSSLVRVCVDLLRDWARLGCVWDWECGGAAGKNEPDSSQTEPRCVDRIWGRAYSSGAEAEG